MLGFGPVPSRGPILLASNWTCFGVSAIFVALRLFARVYRSKTWRSLWWDDLCLLIALALFLCTAIISIEAVNLGFGRHLKDIPPQNFEEISYLGAIMTTQSAITSSLSKTSIALLFWRWAKDVKWMKWSLIVVMVVTNVTFFAGAIQPWVRCSPVEKFWKPLVEGSCYPLKAYMLWGTIEFAWGALIDFFMAALPWFIIPKIQISQREKIGLGLTMSAGVLAGVASAIKAGLIHELLSEDPSWDTLQLNVWSMVEVGITFIVACVPVLRVLFRDVHRQRTTNYAGQTGTGKRVSVYGTNSSKLDRNGSRAMRSQDSGMAVERDDASDESIHFDCDEQRRGSQIGSQEELVSEVKLQDLPKTRKEEV